MGEGVFDAGLRGSLVFGGRPVDRLRLQMNPRRSEGTEAGAPGYMLLPIGLIAYWGELFCVFLISINKKVVLFLTNRPNPCYLNTVSRG